MNSKFSPIYSLSPGVNEDGLLVVQGRLNNASILAVSFRQPVLLPMGHPPNDLFILYYHKIIHHQNDELIVNEIRLKFWVISIRTAVKRAKSSCQYWKNKTVKPMPTLMGQLPKDRVTPYNRPFTYTGLDYFGPLIVTIGRRHEMRWVALLTCFTVRAIHLELA